MNELSSAYGSPGYIRNDNSEFIGKEPAWPVMLTKALKRSTSSPVALGKMVTLNPLNGRLRNECLNCELFYTPNEDPCPYRRLAMEV